MGSKRNGDFTEFPSIIDEDEANAANQPGFIGGIFGRFFKTESPNVIAAPNVRIPPEENGNGAETDLVSEISPARRSNDSQDPDNVSINSEQRRKLSQKLSSLFKTGSRDSELIDYDRSEFKRYWMPDSTVKECYECHEKFSAFRRKHHCRLCGQIFCGKCSNHTINGASLGYAGLLRVCGYCERNVDRYLNLHQLKTPRRDTSTSNTGPDYTNSVPGSSGISTVSDDAFPRVGADPNLLSIQQLHDYQQIIKDAKVIDEPKVADENEPEWVRNISSSTKTDEFKSVECAAFEIQPCIAEEKKVEKSKSFILDTLLAPQLKDGDLHDIFEQKMEKMLDYLFIREQMDKNKWFTTLWPLSKEIASTVKIDMRNRTEDAMNILKYVHIKKLLVADDEPDYEVIDGVACSKTLAHTEMPKHVENASVMILSGGIEYEREPQKLSSIDPIIEQETEYLKNQVERITSRRVTLLLVEDSVAKLASEMFLTAQVALITNVKKSVLERIARSTKATVTSLMDAQMHPAVVGFCPKFKERIVITKEGQKKTILLFDDCDADRGVSVLLRASSRRELRAAKRLLKFLVLSRYSSNLEIAFLKMFETKPSTSPVTCQICLYNSGKKYEESNAFLYELNKAQLSNSPLIHFPPPYLETPIGRSCYLLDYFKKPTSHFFTEEDFIIRREEEEKLEQKIKELKDVLKREEEKIESFKSAVMKKNDVTEADPNVLVQFRARGGLLFQTRRQKKLELVQKIRRQIKQLQLDHSSISLGMKGPNYDVLNPYSHQRVAFLYSSFPKKSVSSPCSGPWLVVWQFYSAQDRTLGTFLANFCLNESYKCKTCNKSMIEHQRKFVHKHARIEITTQIFVKPVSSDENPDGLLPPSFSGENDGILAWRRCPTCKSNSIASLIPSTVWHMSFAKFIDYLANGIYCTSPLAGINSSECDHCTLHEQHHFFSRKNYTTCFKVIPVQPRHVLFAPIICSIEAMKIKCLSVTAKRVEALKLAETIFTEASTFLKEHENFLRNSNDAFEIISSFLGEKKHIFDEMVIDFALNEKFIKNEVIDSKDKDYLKAMDLFAKCRQFLFNFIRKWNECKTTQELVQLARKRANSAIVSANVSSVNLLEPAYVEDLSFRDSTGNLRLASSDSNLPLRELKDIPLSQISIPLPKNYHWELEFNDDGIPVIVKDMLDHKGNTHPDIGSIIAYALSCKSYYRKKKQLREYLCDQGEPLTLRNVACENASGLHSSPKDTHANIEIEFDDSRAHYYVKIYFAEHFDLLRKAIFIDGEDQFIRSLGTSGSWYPEGGKSGASFFRTQDERFIFKQMSSIELECFRKCAPNYFDYIYTAVTEKKLTALCKIYGVYQVAYRNKQDNQEFKMDLLVMEFLFYRRKVKQLWDLKGSLRNRYASPKASAPVLLDENLVQDLWGNQIYIHTHSKAALNQAMANDSHFLTSLDIMDYSLLAGVSEDTDEVMIGIVDYMRTFTLDKKLESFVKTALPTPHLPTIVSPAAYCRRFCEAIDVYFPFSPDQWTELNNSSS
uniref:1-phosphatidylinositol-3-phosphate 5-kinase n=1 Tax=Panagrolaimus superbus TaxID=310955 RepID=A0A914YUS2_9BILA